MKRTFLSFAILLLIPFSLCAQENACLRRTVLVNVVDRNEMPVEGMTPENFRGNFQGAPLRILSATWNNSPRRIVILLDLSDNMAGQRQWGASNKNQFVEFLARDALLSTRRDDKVSVVTFANTVTQRSSLATDRKLANAWMDQMSREDRKLFKGRSALFEALGTAVDILSPYQPGDAIYLITDSSNRVLQKHVGDIESRFLSTGVRLFALLLQDRNTYAFARDVRTTSLVEELLEPTGGASWVMASASVAPRGSLYDMSAAGQKEIRAVANSLYKQIEQFYLTEIELPQVVKKPQSWKLEVIAHGEQQIKGFHVYYQTKLLPCSAATTKKDGQP